MRCHYRIWRRGMVCVLILSHGAADLLEQQWSSWTYYTYDRWKFFFLFFFSIPGLNYKLVQHLSSDTVENLPMTSKVEDAAGS